MSDNLQLQVIDPTNQISYYPLDPEWISVTIGAAPTNDVQLQDAEIAALQFVLDLPLPRRIMALSERGNARLAGEKLQPNEYKPLEIGQRVEVGRSSLILLEMNGASSGAEPQTVTKGIVTTSAVPSERKTKQNIYQTKNFRIVNVIDFEITQNVDINQPGVWQVDLENTSQSAPNTGRNANFYFRVEDHSANWEIEIAPSTMLLAHELSKDIPKRDRCRIKVTPLKTSLPYAGKHELRLFITSPDFRDDELTVPLKLEMATYSVYEVSSLSRTKLQVRSKTPAPVNFTITNKSNCPARFTVTGNAEDFAGKIELLERDQIPGFGTWVETSTLELKPNEQTKVQARIYPTRLYWFGNGQHYPLMFTIKLLDTTATKQTVEPKQLKGDLFQGALISYGALLWILLGLLLLFFVLLLFLRPSINKFIITDVSSLPIKAEEDPKKPTATPIASEPKTTVAGSLVKLDWQTKHVTQLVITRLLDNNREEPVLTNNKNISITGQYTFTARNGEGATYVLRGINWIANLPLISSLGIAEQRVRLNVAPVVVTLYPKVDTNNLVVGQSLPLSWTVSEKNTQVILFKNNQPEPITGTNYITGTAATYTDQPITDTTYQIQSQSAYPHDPVLSPPLKVKVRQPAPPPVSAPKIRRFEVMPPQLTAGQKVTILYDVSGATTLLLLLNDAQVAELQPPVGQEQIVLPDAKRYRITLKAVAKINGAPPVETQKWHTVEALPAPLPPQIQMFKAVPESVERGSDAAKNITLAWSLTTDAKNIRILTPDKLIASNLPYSGTLKLAVDQSTNYQILADGPDGAPVSKVVNLTVTDSAVAKGLQKQSLPPAKLTIDDSKTGDDLQIDKCAEHNSNTDQICIFKISPQFPALSVTIVGVNKDCQRILWKQWRYDQISADGIKYQCRRCEKGTYTVYAENADGIVTEENYTYPKDDVEIICK
ncbi:MAG: FHA domain-containing protein [Caldilineaceae bacterium]